MNAPGSPSPPVSNMAPTMLPVLPVVMPELPHLPASRSEMKARGWDYVDVLFVTGDAYVDHPAFAMGILEPGPGSGRVPRGDLEPARLAKSPTPGGSSAGPGCLSASVPATWTA